MKQQVQECYEELHMALQEDEQTVLDMIEQDRRETSSKLNRILQDWNQHLGLLQKHISTMQSAQQSPAETMKQVTVKDETCISCCWNNLEKKRAGITYIVFCMFSAFSRFLRILRKAIFFLYMTGRFCDRIYIDNLIVCQNNNAYRVLFNSKHAVHYNICNMPTFTFSI